MGLIHWINFNKKNTEARRLQYCVNRNTLWHLRPDLIHFVIVGRPTIFIFLV